MDEQDEPVRIDKWLWAARFFKTRALAAEAVGGGKVEIRGERAKPSRIVRAGYRITVRRGLRMDRHREECCAAARSGGAGAAAL